MYLTEAKDTSTRLRQEGQATRNPAHRRPWLKMKIEYHPALIFCAFVRGFLKFQVYTLFVAEFHWKVSKMAFSPQRNDNFNVFLKMT